MSEPALLGPEPTAGLRAPVCGQWQPGQQVAAFTSSARPGQLRYTRTSQVRGAPSSSHTRVHCSQASRNHRQPRIQPPTHNHTQAPTHTTTHLTDSGHICGNRPERGVQGGRPEGPHVGCDSRLDGVGEDLVGTDPVQGPRLPEDPRRQSLAPTGPSAWAPRAWLAPSRKPEYPPDLPGEARSRGV